MSDLELRDDELICDGCNLAFFTANGAERPCPEPECDGTLCKTLL